MDKEAQLLRAIDLLYGSILDKNELQPALGAVSEFADARGAYHLTFDRLRGVAVSSTSVGVDPEAQNEYLHQYSAQDVRVPAALDKPAGSLVTEHTLVDPDFFHASELYRAFLQRYDIPHFLAVWTQKSDTHLSALAIQRTARQRAFLKPDEEHLAPLVPHLVRALRIREAFKGARAAHAAYGTVINRLPFGVVMLNWDRSVNEMSSAAERLFRTSHIIRCRQGRVHAARGDDDSRLQRAIHVAMTGAASRDLPGRALTLFDRHRHRCLRVTVLPVPKPHPSMNRHPACMLLVVDPNTLGTPSVETIMELLQLTAAEARLACELCKGISLREAATALGVSVNTCKTQLKSIYARTGCRSHVDLVKALLLSGLAQDISRSETDPTIGTTDSRPTSQR
jgi:DNA-binding CsgD family transcriptional regulator